jgi:hypothetical protein
MNPRSPYFSAVEFTIRQQTNRYTSNSPWLLRLLMRRSSDGRDSPSHPPAAASLIDPAVDSRFHLFPWSDGSMHMVKQGWRFPSADLKATWNVWQYGDVSQHIRPLRYLQKADLLEAQAPLWSKTAGVMKLIAETMVEMKEAQTVRDVQRLPQEASAEAFDRAIVQLMERVREGSTRSKRDGRRCLWPHCMGW